MKSENTETEKKELADLNDLIVDVGSMKSEIAEKRENIETEGSTKPKKRGRPKKVDKEEQEQREMEQQKAIMQSVGRTALIPLISLLDSIIKARVKNWDSIIPEEQANLADALNNVIMKYLPNISGYQEEFALGLVLMGIVGARLPKLTTTKVKKE